MPGINHSRRELSKSWADKDKALLQELCFGVLRTLSQLEWLISKLMARPMTGKQRTVHFLIMVGLYQLLYTPRRSPATAPARPAAGVSAAIWDEDSGFHAQQIRLTTLPAGAGTGVARR